MKQNNSQLKMCECNQGRMECTCRDAIGEVIAEDLGLEAVVWARQCDLNESDPAIFVAREEVRESGYTVPLYAHSGAGEVERLRAELVTQQLRADAAVGDANEAERKLAERDALLESVAEGATILRGMIESIEAHGNYSQESTINFLNQALGCVSPAFLLSASAEPAIRRHECCCGETDELIGEARALLNGGRDE